MTATDKGGPLQWRGVNYDVGTRFGGFETSHSRLSREIVRRDLEAIRDELNCNAVQIYGSDVARIADMAGQALELGLEVWVEPRLVDADPPAVLAQLRDLARLSQKLLERGGRISLTVGCELSIFMRDVVPGGSYQERIEALPAMAGDFRSLNEALNEHLSKAVVEARAAFSGPLTYAAGPWEMPDWSIFDQIGLDHYWMDLTRDRYVEVLRHHRASGKPVIIMEFGCCAYRGAEAKGSAGYDIIDWTAAPPAIRGDIVRDEQVQAEYLERLISLYRLEGMAGAFVYTFSNCDLRHQPSPTHDLDLASFAIVKTSAVPEDGGYVWERKQAFDAVARGFSE